MGKSKSNNPYTELINRLDTYNKSLKDNKPRKRGGKKNVR